jgi:hypothetical protein
MKLVMMQNIRCPSVPVSRSFQQASFHPFRKCTTRRAAINRSRFAIRKSDMQTLSAGPEDASIVRDVPEPEDARGAIAVGLMKYYEG